MQANHIGQGYLIVLLATLMVVAFGRLQPAIPWVGERLVAYDWLAAVQREAPEALPACDSLPGEPGGPLLVSDGRFPSEVEEQYQGFSHLEKFFVALKATRKDGRRLRIGYFGDSMIEGDLITQSLRSSLQSQLGGQGVGFVPVTSIAPGFRRSIRQQFSGDWQHFTCIEENPTAHPLGISGELFLPGKHSRSWVEFRATPLYPQTQTFHQIKLYYGQAPGAEGAASSAKVSLLTGQASANERSVSLPMPASQAVNELSLVEWPTKDARLSFRFQEELPLYGLSFEDETGVYVDNLPVRGHTGLQLKEIPGPVLEGFQQYLDYKLVVLHFGLNAMYMYERDGNYDRYREGMIEVVEHFKQHLPDAAILIVSVTDRAQKVRGRMATSPGVPLLVQTQREVARHCQVGFFNLFEAMGGDNTMVKWVESHTPLANKDYAHVNFQGAERLAQLIEAYIWEGYQYYDPESSQPIAGLKDLGKGESAPKKN